MALKFDNIFSLERHSKFDPTWDFWFENKPSGNPAVPTKSDNFEFQHQSQSKI
jgi:hypothetical protein